MNDMTPATAGGPEKAEKTAAYRRKKLARAEKAIAMIDQGLAGTDLDDVDAAAPCVLLELIGAGLYDPEKFGPICARALRDLRAQHVNEAVTVAAKLGFQWTEAPIDGVPPGAAGYPRSSE